jgi:hypothetical protein
MCYTQGLGAGFAVYLQHVVPLAVESLEQDDGMASDGSDAEGENGGQRQGGEVLPFLILDICEDWFSLPRLISLCGRRVVEK